MAIGNKLVTFVPSDALGDAIKFFPHPLRFIMAKKYRPSTSIAMWDPQPSSQQRACDSRCQKGVASNEHPPSLDALEE